jgi:hypothetical protein
VDWDFDEAVSRLILLTDEIGLVARDSVATAGQYVYFLSDSGVYRLDSRLDLKLRGDTRPLSDAIADQFAGVTGSAAHRAVGRWFGNRYWLAVPMDGAEQNNTIFVFNALNEQWESRDSYGVPIDNLLVSGFDGERRLFASSRNGRLYLLDELEGGDMAESGAELVPVVGSLRTRRYGMGSLRTKRFLRASAELLVDAGGAMGLSAAVLNPDVESVVASYSNSSGAEEELVLKGPVRRRGSAVELVVTTSAGRPQVRAVQIEGATSDRPGTNTRSKE